MVQEMNKYNYVTQIKYSRTLLVQISNAIDCTNINVNVPMLNSSFIYHFLLYTDSGIWNIFNL